jgi:hypothetical protein
LLIVDLKTGAHPALGFSSINQQLSINNVNVRRAPLTGSLTRWIMYGIAPSFNG